MAVCYRYGYPYNCQSGWYNWGRWVLLGVIIFAAIAIFFLFSCINARRRRSAGRRPMYGTGWAATGPFNPNQNNYNPNYNHQQAPPQYSQNQGAPQGGYYGQNQSYFGGQQSGVEMQSPPNAYKGGDNVYQPPTGPPPGK